MQFRLKTLLGVVTIAAVLTWIAGYPAVVPALLVGLACFLFNVLPFLGRVVDSETQRRENRRLN